MVPFAELAGYVRENIGWDISVKNGFRHLRFSHRKDGDADVYMLFNESVDETLSAEVSFAADHGTMLEYDAYTGKLIRRNDRCITLEPYETRFIVFGADAEAAEPEAPLTETVSKLTNWKFTVEGKEYQELCNIALKHPRFAGTVAYETEFAGSDGRVLDLGYAGETVEVILNGENLGTRIAPPYRFDVAGKLREHNRIQVNVTTHLGYERRDQFSSYLMLEPLGLIGPVELKK